MISERKSWLQDHLEGFVYPRLNEWGVNRGVLENHVTQSPFFTPQEMSIIKNSWRSAKKLAGGKPVGLLGRDVWIYEVLARRENYPTLFLPQCSRQTVYLIDREMNHNIPEFIFDTGFVGSIPRALRRDKFALLSAENLNWMDDLLPAQKRKSQDTKQIFPMLKGARSLALKIESTPKYWDCAINDCGKIVQLTAKKEEFIRAAILTLQVYKDSSRREAPRGSLGGEKWQTFKPEKGKSIFASFDEESSVQWKEKAQILYTQYLGSTSKPGTSLAKQDAAIIGLDQVKVGIFPSVWTESDESI